MKEDLSPLYEPDPISFSFETEGWYIVGFILLLFFLFSAFKRFQTYRKNAYKRAAVSTLKNIESKWKNEHDVACINEVNVVLKVVAIQTFGRKNVAALYGKDWISFLESKAKHTSFIEYGDLFASASADENIGEVSIDKINRLFKTAINWINTHA